MNLHFRKIFLCFAILLVSVSYSMAQKYSKVSIDLTQSTMSQIAQLGIPVDHGELRKNSYFITDLSKDEIDLLQQNGMQYTIIIDDVAGFYRNRNNQQSKLYSGVKPKPLASTGCGNSSSVYPTPLNFTLGSQGGFFTYAQFLAHIDTMAAKFPNFISVRQPIDTFTSIEGRPIYWVKISDNPTVDENEPEVLYTAMHHAREPGALSQLIFYMYYLLENYVSDSSIANLVNNTEMYFIPMVNPDGYIYNETTNPTGGGMWRKNRRNNGDGTFGVDLNRNYGYFWGYDNTGSSPTTNSETYRGTLPFSEPETQAVKYFAENHNIKTALHYHTYGNLLIYPWGYDYSLYTPDSAIFVEYAKLMTLENSYTYGTGDQTVGYITNGDSDDWMYGEQGTKPKILSCTPEVGTSSDGFWPPQSRIIPQCQENLWQNLTMARLAGKYAAATDLSPQYISQKTGYFLYDIQRLGLDSPAAFTVEIVPISPEITTIGSQKIYSNMTLLENITDSIYYELDTSIMMGQPFSFLITVNNGMFVTKDTISKVYGQLTPIFADPANNLSNWNTVSWGVSTTTYYSPSGSITDSPFGDYQNNSNTSITLSTPIDLTGAMQANLTFWTKWEIEPGYDYAQVSASSDGGTTWTPLCGNYTKPGNGNQDQGNPVFDGFQSTWVLEEMNLNVFAGKSILIRYRLVSDTWSVGDGFYFDDFSVKAIDNNMAIAITAVFPNCSSNNGSATAIASGGVAPYTYLWDAPGAQTTNTATDLSVGWYHVTVSDNLGFSLSDSTEIINAGAANISAAATNLSCYGSGDGSITLTVNGGTSPYTFNWSSDDTIQNPGGLAAGGYTVTVTDNNGCVAVSGITLTQPAALIVTAVITNDSVSSGTGAIDITISGGVSPLSYAWNNAAATEDISGLTAGIYGITVTDADGCTGSALLTVSNVTGISLVDLTGSLKIFPNPNSGNFLIEIPDFSPEGYTAVIKNVLGQTLMERKMDKTGSAVQLDLSGIESGIYFLSITNSKSRDEIAVAKVLINKP